MVRYELGQCLFDLLRILFAELDNDSPVEICGRIDVQRSVFISIDDPKILYGRMGDIAFIDQNTSIGNRDLNLARFVPGKKNYEDGKNSAADSTKYIALHY